VLASENLSCKLIVDWYVAHREAGGNADPAADTVLHLLAFDGGGFG